jgi:hypothetical protein
VAISRERPHSTGVESAIHTSSVNMLVSRPSTPISQAIVSSNGLEQNVAATRVVAASH